MIPGNEFVVAEKARLECFKEVCSPRHAAIGELGNLLIIHFPCQRTVLETRQLIANSFGQRVKAVEINTPDAVRG
jgi:hypothetical protein